MQQFSQTTWFYKDRHDTNKSMYMIQTIMTKFHQINTNHKIPFEENAPNLKLQSTEI